MKSYTIAGGLFTPRRGPTLFTIGGIILLLMLGSWQIQRMAWKQNLVAKIHERMAAAPTDLPTMIPDPAALDYTRVQVTGTFHHDKEFYLAARDVKYSVYGLQILTPLETADHHFVLVSRGWVPSEKKNPETRTAAQVSSTVTITGIARLPKGRGWLVPDNSPAQNFWLWVDLPAMAATAGIQEFSPLLIEADDTANAGGFPVGGQTRVSFPDNHFVYAITWFCLAIALAVIYFLAHWQREKPTP